MGTLVLHRFRALALGCAVSLFLVGCPPGDDDDDDDNDDGTEATETPGTTPTDSPEPTGTPGETPTGTPGETPTGTPGETPTETPGVTPTGTPGGTPTESPAPTESPSPTPGPGEEARLIEVIATEFDFNPEQLYARPGETLIIRLRNEGNAVHNIAFEFPSGDVALPENVPAGDTAELTVTVPPAAGDYTYYCPVGNHREQGMVGTLTVALPTYYATEIFASGLTAPVAMAMPDDESGRAFIVDQIGKIWIVQPDGSVPEDPFLDLSEEIVSLNTEYDERGLLGLAFHPDYADNGRFFVYYSAPLREEAPDDWNHTSRLSEFTVSGDDADRADPTSERVILDVDQPQSNHNGGTLLFGPDDGYLYLSLGDGGGAGDVGLGHTPLIGNGQDLGNLLGSILRIDVDTGDPYAIPADNPFVGSLTVEHEIWAYGFRNPYRMSFDMGGENALFVGDAGQALWEEVSIAESGGNYGWNRLEGTHCFNPADFDDPPPVCLQTGEGGETLRWPVIELPNSAQEGGAGSVIVGGHVYRGPELPGLGGMYLFGMWSTVEDVPSGAVYAAMDESDDGDLWPARMLWFQGNQQGHLGRYLLGFGQDLDGEIYVLTSDRVGPSEFTGRVYKLIPPFDEE